MSPDRYFEHVFGIRSHGLICEESLDGPQFKSPPCWALGCFDSPISSQNCFEAILLAHLSMWQHQHTHDFRAPGQDCGIDQGTLHITKRAREGLTGDPSDVPRGRNICAVITMIPSAAKILTLRRKNSNTFVRYTMVLSFNT